MFPVYTHQGKTQNKETTDGFSYIFLSEIYLTTWQASKTIEKFKSKIKYLKQNYGGAKSASTLLKSRKN
jgi:hypothetical protein